jgi:hypothetical protein
MSDERDDREKGEGRPRDDASKRAGEPGGEDPGSHPFDKELHPADEKARRASSGRGSKEKRG